MSRKHFEFTLHNNPPWRLPCYLIENNTSSVVVPFSFQFGEFAFASDCDDEELCKLAAEWEDLDYRNYNPSNSETQQVLQTAHNSNGVATSRREGVVINWDDDRDDDALLEVRVPHDSHINEGGVSPAMDSLQTHHKKTLDALQENEQDTRESLESLDDGMFNGRTLNIAEPVAATRFFCSEVSGHVESHPNGKDGMKTCQSCRGLSRDRCSCGNNKVVSTCTSDEDVCEWLDEDPVSDLELSFAAEEAESRTN